MTAAAQPKRIGRPSKAPEDRIVTPVRTLRLSDAHWSELQARGGVDALRKWLSAPEGKRAKARP